jgi:hypothetical protein
MGKICSTCKMERPLSEFWGRPSSIDGLRGRCITCSKAKHAEWMAVNVERKREYDRAYYRENAEAINAADREAYAANSEAFNEKQRNWRAQNPDLVSAANRRKREKHGDRLRARRRQHYRENSAAYKAAAVARKEHIRIATPLWANLKKIEATYAEAERLTKKTGIPHHVDHIYPLRGKTMCGLHVEGNLQILRAIVNLRKSNRVDIGSSIELGI